MNTIDSFDTAPGYPVIVVHLADPNHLKLAACGPVLLRSVSDEYLNVPRYQCQACFRLLTKET